MVIVVDERGTGHKQRARDLHSGQEPTGPVGDKGPGERGYGMGVEGVGGSEADWHMVMELRSFHGLKGRRVFVGYGYHGECRLHLSSGSRLMTVPLLCLSAAGDELEVVWY